MNEIKELEVYRGFRLTTRLTCDGVRIYRPHGNGVEFAMSLEEARAWVDSQYARG